MIFVAPIKSLNNPKQKEILAHRATKVRDKSHPLILAHRETKVTQSDKNHLPIKSLRLALNTRHTQSHGTEINLTKMPSSDKHHFVCATGHSDGLFSSRASLWLRKALTWPSCSLVAASM